MSKRRVLRLRFVEGLEFFRYQDMNAREAVESTNDRDMHDWIGVVFPELDSTIEEIRYEGQLRDTSQEHDCDFKRHDVDFYPFLCLNP